MSTIDQNRIFALPDTVAPYSNYASWRKQARVLWRGEYFDGAWVVSRGGVKEPGMGGVMAPAEPGVKRGFERFQGCGFLPFLATAF
ncbi:hypothetical protein K6W42_06485, partial [Burkholderia contaminans]|nr:hypothetical protein [Burkholderia contaminans]